MIWYQAITTQAAPQVSIARAAAQHISNVYLEGDMVDEWCESAAEMAFIHKIENRLLFHKHTYITFSGVQRDIIQKYNERFRQCLTPYS